MPKSKKRPKAVAKKRWEKAPAAGANAPTIAGLVPRASFT